MSSLTVDPPKFLSKPLVVPPRLLLTAGPANSPPRILHAMSLPVIGHCTDKAYEIMDEVKAGLQYVFQTKNEVTLAISASGHGGMEAAVSNLLEPGDNVLILVNGLWGERASSMSQRYGAKVNRLEKELGTNFSLAEIEAGLIKYRPDVVFACQGESSTGVLQPIEGLGDLCHRYNSLLIVDTVASLGGTPFYADKWGVDVVYTGSQKVLGVPPGLAPISFSPRAVKRVQARKTPVAVFYWDLLELANYWGCFPEPRKYHHTIAVNLLYALREGLSIVSEEGLEQLWQKHKRAAALLHEGLKQLNTTFFVKDELARLPTVTSIKVPLPGNTDGKYVVDYLLDKFSIEISGGLGPSVGKVIRIGLMGYNATTENIQTVLSALREAITSQSKL